MSFETENEKLKQNEVITYESKVNIKNIKDDYEKLIIDIGAIGDIEKEIGFGKILLPCVELSKNKKWFVTAIDLPFITVEDIITVEEFCENDLQKLKRKNLGMRILETNYKTLPFDTSIFDRVEMHYVLTICDKNAKNILSEADRVLKPGGVMMISGEYGSLVNLDRKQKKLLHKFIQKKKYTKIKPVTKQVMVSNFGEEFGDEKEHRLYMLRKPVEKDKRGILNSLKKWITNWM